MHVRDPGSTKMRSHLALATLFAALALAGCGAANRSSQPIHIWKQFNETSAAYIPPKLMSSIPASLGFLLPSVPHYECRGAYTPAQRAPFTPNLSPSQMGLPFWQLLVQCVNPTLHLHLPKGRMQAGMVWVNEMPGNPSATLRHAMGATQGLTGIHLTALGHLRVGEGHLVFGGYHDNIVWFTRGKTTWISNGKRATAPVLVYITGRAVPVALLQEFAKSMRPASGGA